MKSLTHHLPADIEKTSMSIIKRELGEQGIFIPEAVAPVVLRAIHTTADFDYAKNMSFTDHAVERAAASCKSGGILVTDTEMSLSGISKKALSALQMEVVCLTGDPEAAEFAKEHEITRAAAGITLAAARFPEAGFLIGNAPTALFVLAEKIEADLRPAFVVGVPVGFVNVVESKEAVFSACKSADIPAIIARGRKGGSTVATAVANAILYLAADMLDPKDRGWL